MRAYRERRRSDNPTLWVVTTTGDQSCRMSHVMSKSERKSGLRALPAPASRPHGLSLPNWEVALRGGALPGDLPPSRCLMTSTYTLTHPASPYDMADYAWLMGVSLVI